MLKSKNTAPQDQELNSIKSRIDLRKMRYYLKHKILLILLRSFCFLGPDIFPYVQSVRVGPPVPHHFISTAQGQNNFLLYNSQLGFRWLRSVYTLI